MSDWCRECQVHHGKDRHLIAYEVWPDDGDRGLCWTIRARNREGAAERWIADGDRGHFTSVPEGATVVRVALPGEDPARFGVTGEMVPKYTAEEL